MIGFRGFDNEGCLIREVVMGRGSLFISSFVFPHRLCCSGSNNSFTMRMPPHLLSACSGGVEVVLGIPRPIVDLIHGRWESAVRACASSLEIGVCRVLRAWRMRRFGVSVAGGESFESVEAGIELGEGFGGFSWVGETAEGDQLLGQGFWRRWRMYVDEIAGVGCGLLGGGHDWL